ncbi:MAG: hypothetical protein P4N60_02260 [Verrucomicrobiae bacterium]|nr:hypothetical protein [Verrucomicrobiae bacterium]
MTTNLQAALNTYQNLYMPAGTYITSVTIYFPVGGIITGAGSNTVMHPTAAVQNIFAAIGTDTNNVGSNVVASLCFTGTTSQTGFYAVKATNVTIQGCFAQTVRLFRSSYAKTNYTRVSSEDDLNRYITIVSNVITAPASAPGTVAGIDVEYVADAEIAYNVVQYYLHGIMWWGGDSNFSVNGSLANPRWARRLHIATNSVSNFTEGGIWGSMGQNVTVEGNTIANCGDVGLDFEGCFNSIGRSNSVTDGVNGALTTFFGASNVTFQANNVTTDNPGWPLFRIYNSSLSPGQVLNVVLASNTFVSTFGIGTIDDVTGPGNLQVMGNTLVNAEIDFFRGTGGFNGQTPSVTGNVFTYTRDIPDAFAAVDAAYYFGNPVVSSNIFNYPGATVSNKTAVLLIKNQSGSGTMNVSCNLISGFGNMEVLTYYSLGTSVAANINQNTVQYGSLDVGLSGDLNVAATGNTNLNGTAVPMTWLASPVTPTAPRAVIAAPALGSISISWTPTSGVSTSCTVKRSTTSGGPYTNIASAVTSRSYTDTNVSTGATYYYVVSDVNSTLESPNSSEVSTKPGFVKDNADASGIIITGTWGASTATSGYYGTNYLQDGNTGGVGGKSVQFTPTLSTGGVYGVYLRWTSSASRASNVPVDVNYAGGTQTFSVNEQVDGGTWVLLGNFNFNAGTGGNVKVRNDGANNYVVADAVEFVPAQGPSGLTATSTNGITLNWPATFGATGYNIKRSTTSGGPYAIIASNGTSNSYDDSGLTGGVTYYYVVSTLGRFGESANSSEASGNAVSQTPFKINYKTILNGLLLIWPADHIGWRLEEQVSDSGLGAKWTTVSGSNNTNMVSIQGISGNSNTFFRLVFP